MKNPQTTFAPTFLTHIIAKIDGVYYSAGEKRSKIPNKIRAFEIYQKQYRYRYALSYRYQVLFTKSLCSGIVIQSIPEVYKAKLPCFYPKTTFLTTSPYSKYIAFYIPSSSTSVVKIFKLQ